ncbi:MAG: hypothetical protein J6C25_02280, partial [Treponema sp.]|nr:hypothetical protein [Treponema sp.]
FVYERISKSPEAQNQTGEKILVIINPKNQECKVPLSATTASPKLLCTNCPETKISTSENNNQFVFVPGTSYAIVKL